MSSADVSREGADVPGARDTAYEIRGRLVRAIVRGSGIPAPRRTVRTLERFEARGLTWLSAEVSEADLKELKFSCSRRLAPKKRRSPPRARLERGGQGAQAHTRHAADFVGCAIPMGTDTLAALA